MEKGTETSSYEINTKVKSLITSSHNRAIKDTSGGTLKSDDDDGDGGGNISRSPTLSNVDELCWSGIPENHNQVKKEEENFAVACSRPPQKMKLGIFTT